VNLAIPASLGLAEVHCEEGGGPRTSEPRPYPAGRDDGGRCCTPRSGGERPSKPCQKPRFGTPGGHPHVPDMGGPWANCANLSVRCV
jgi:hypothetical protein